MRGILVAQMRLVYGEQGEAGRGREGTNDD